MLNRYTGNSRIVGSNPIPSATVSFKKAQYRLGYRGPFPSGLFEFSCCRFYGEPCCVMLPLMERLPSLSMAKRRLSPIEYTRVLPSHSTQLLELLKQTS